MILSSAQFLCTFIVLLLCACDSHLSGEPPLHRAAYKGDAEAIKELIKAGESVHSLNSEGATPLHWAAFKGKSEAAKLLLRYGADVNARTKKGSTPLRLAVTHKNHEVASILKARGGVEE